MLLTLAVPVRVGSRKEYLLHLTRMGLFAQRLTKVLGDWEPSRETQAPRVSDYI